MSNDSRGDADPHLLRKRHTGESGNPGELGSTPNAGSGLSINHDNDTLTQVSEHALTLAEALGRHLPGVAHRVDQLAGCGTPPMSRWVTLTSTSGRLVVDGKVEPEFTIQGYVTSDGYLREMTATRTWTKARGPWTTNSTSCRIPEAKVDGVAAVLPFAMRVLQDQEARQRVLDERVNDAQGERPVFLATVSGQFVKFEGLGRPGFTSTTLNLDAPEDAYAPEISPPGMGRVAVAYVSAPAVLEYLGREVLMATDRFDLIAGERPGVRHLTSLMSDLLLARPLADEGSVTQPKGA